MTTSPLEHQADKLAAERDYAAARAMLSHAATAEPDNFGIWLKLSAMCSATGDRHAALASVNKAITLAPRDFTALMMRATHLDALGDTDEAGEAFGRALAQQPDSTPTQIQPLINTARLKYAAWQTKHAVMLRAAVVAVTPLTEKLEYFIDTILHISPPKRDGPTHYCYPGLPEIPFLEEGRFDWFADLAAATDTIQAEFQMVVKAEAAQLVPYIQYPEGVPIDRWTKLNHHSDWTAIHLLQNGRLIAENAQHCPQTMELLQTISQPTINGAGPNAMFSLLAPGAHIPPHTGISNARLVCHLPLIVPEDCWFRVADDVRFWQRGKPWVFDDTIEHEAMNQSHALRTILIFDVWHPALTTEERRGITAIIEAGTGLHGL